MGFNAANKTINMNAYNVAHEAHKQHDMQLNCFFFCRYLFRFNKPSSNIQNKILRASNGQFELKYLREYV